MIPLRTRQHIWFISVAVCVLGLDRITKKIVEASVPLFSSFDFVGSFIRITHVKNTGIAFGLFAGIENAFLSVFLSLLSLFAVGFVVHVYRHCKKSVLEQISLGAILGGAFGNLFDRFVYRQVTDFVDMGIGSFRWYTYNISDIAIVIGLILLFVQLIKDEAGKKSKPDVFQVDTKEEC